MKQPSERKKRQLFCYNIINELIGEKLLYDDSQKYLDNLWAEKYKNTGKDELFYDLDIFLWNPYATYVSSSKDYVNQLFRFFKKIQYEPKNILDFGAGVGLTTCDLAEAFPNSTIFYYNLGTVQQNIFKKISKEFNIKNIKIIDDFKKANADVVVCFELFEHIKEPIPLMKTFYELEDTKFVCEASSFNMNIPAGHYDEYLFDNNIISGKLSKKEFNKQSRKMGFISSKNQYNIACWNSRPTVWVKSDKKPNENVLSFF